MTWIVGTSLLLQLTAAALALRLIRVTGRRTAWILIASACVLMTVRRAVTFTRLFVDPTLQVDVTTECITLGVSCLMVSGVVLIGAVFRELRDEHERRLEAEAQRARAELEMVERQRLESLGLLAGGVAHDFNNLLTVILGNAALAQKSGVPRVQVAEALAQIEQAARHAADLASRLLAYAGRGRVEVAERDLGELVRDSRDLLAAAIPSSVRLETELAPIALPVRGDAVQLTQVLMNLAINASEAIGEREGSIRIRTGAIEVDPAWLGSAVAPNDARVGRCALLEVTDTGAGIGEDARERMFLPFFSTKGQGRGLGLATVLGIVRGHGGAVRVRSEVGRGTTFEVALPLASPTASSDAQPSASQASPAGEVSAATVLVADDEPAVRTMTRRVLERAGFTVVLAAGGREALEIVAARRAELALVLADRAMPDLGGEEVARRLAKTHPDLPVVMVSGFGEQEEIEALIGCRLAGFVHKPFDVDELVAVAMRVLAEGGQMNKAG